jgi:hypothetical protein
VQMNGEAAPEPQRKSVHEEHWCEHDGCKRWGSFGFDTRDGTVWYCGEHRLKDYGGKE